MDAKISLFKAQLIAAREYAAMKQEAKSIADEHDAIIEAAAKNLGIPVRWGSQPSNKQP